jgi:hypothetical protein
VDGAELEALRRDMTVLGTRWHEGRRVVHVLSDARPGPGFEPVAPDLQDLYLRTVRDASPA